MRSFILVAGHGLIDPGGAYYFAPFDMKFDHPASKGLSFSDLSSLFDNIPARKKVLLLDTCDAGEVDTAGSNLTNNYHVVQKHPGVEVLTLAEPMRKLALGEVFLDLRRGNGTFAIGASSAFQAAGETSKLGNGRFTYALLRFMTLSFEDCWKRDVVLALPTESRASRFSGLCQQRSDNSNRLLEYLGNSIESTLFGGGWNRAISATLFLEARRMRPARFVVPHASQSPCCRSSETAERVLPSRTIGRGKHRRWDVPARLRCPLRTRSCRGERQRTHTTQQCCFFSHR
jgi:hypothetical protein